MEQKTRDGICVLLDVTPAWWNHKNRSPGARARAIQLALEEIVSCRAIATDEMLQVEAFIPADVTLEMMERKRTTLVEKLQTTERCEA